MWAQYFGNPLRKTYFTKFPLADSDKFVYFFMSQAWTTKLIESMNTCHFSDRFARTIKVNIK